MKYFLRPSMRFSRRLRRSLADFREFGEKSVEHPCGTIPTQSSISRMRNALWSSLAFMQGATPSSGKAGSEIVLNEPESLAPTPRTLGAGRSVVRMTSSYRYKRIRRRGS